ncbi:MAG: hypothetical protein IT365_12155 [Candidatus Hydrogenedentes bacterium]|nr:hypothetical protein [Candidatus Hydrogenedentota bacterium]
MRNGSLLFVAVVATGVGAGLLFGWSRLSEPAVSAERAGGVPEEAVASEDPDVVVALRYARALQDGFCEEIVRRTAWMDDRMQRVALESSGEDAMETAWDSLCMKALDRSVEGNILQPEGIEDWYLFAPGATFEVVGVDPGRDDLDRAVAKRVWIRVTFSRQQTAPLARAEEGGEMMAVRAVTVGINLSREGRLVVKAGVLGNLDIDMSSLSFDWTSEMGG